MILKKSKFIKLKIVAQIDDEEEERNPAGFGDAQQPKKKKSKKKPELVVTEALIPLDAITSIIKEGEMIMVDTLDKTFQVINNFDKLSKKLGALEVK